MGMFDFIKKMVNPEDARETAVVQSKVVKKKSQPKQKPKTKAKPKAVASKKIAKKTTLKAAKPSAKKSNAAKKLKTPKPNAKAALGKPEFQHEGQEIGKIIHYFDKISVGIIKLKAVLKLGDTIHIHGAHDDFKQVVDSLQVDHKDIPFAGKGKEVGIKVSQRVRENDRVYKVD